MELLILNYFGVSVDGFVGLVNLYLQINLVEHGRNIYRRKKGVCIGSCQAPVFSDIFLLLVGRAIMAYIDNSSSGGYVFRYVDDRLIIRPHSISLIIITDALFPFGLTFT